MNDAHMVLAQIGSYHYVSGVDASSSASLAAYLNSLTYAVEDSQAWFSKMRPRAIVVIPGQCNRLRAIASAIEDAVIPSWSRDVARKDHGPSLQPSKTLRTSSG